MLRLENLDTDLPLPPEAVSVTRSALDDRSRTRGCRSRVTLGCGRRSPTTSRRAHGHAYDPGSEIVVTCGGCEAVLDILLATIDPGDEVVLTDPIYAGLVNRVRPGGRRARVRRWPWTTASWRLDRDALAAVVSAGPSRC